MSFIPVVKFPYPDELLYSWVCRLADENSLSTFSFSRAYLHPQKEYAHAVYLPVDIREEFPTFWQNVYIHKGSMEETYLNLTTFQFEAMFMPPLQQVRYINNVFRPRNGLNPPINELFKTLHVCGECIEEDMVKYGKPYIHRSHQLSGVCTCHKHGTVLLEYHGKRNHECEFDLSDYREVNTDVPISGLNTYTEYAQALFETRINTNIYKIKDAFFERMKERGYGAADNYSSFSGGLQQWEHAALLADMNLSNFLKTKMISCKNVSVEEMLPLLMFLFPDVSDLIAKINTDSPILEKYVCPECGTEFCSSPVAMENGWGCTSCDSALTEQELFRWVMEKTGCGDYELLSEFESMDKPVQIRHKTCGSVSAMKPRAFLFEGVRCLCENQVTERDAREAIEAHSGFKLLRFNGTKNPVTIWHEECGRKFSCNYYKFLNFPGCRMCNPKVMTAEIYESRVKDLVGDEYTIVKGFVAQSTKIVLRHNVCGQTQAYKPSAFLDGQRCKSCRSLRSHAELEKMLDSYSGGKYVITEYGRNVCTVLDTDTGKTFPLSPLKIAQEIQRKTPSTILPVDNKSDMIYELSSAWENGFQIYLKYIDETGNTNAPKNLVYDGYKLGLWCQRQRAAKNKGVLGKIHETRLTETGFIWEPLEEEWLRRYGQYKRYIVQTGSPRIPRRIDFEGEHLGAWVDTQRRRHNEGKLSKAREDMLLLLNPDLF